MADAAAPAPRELGWRRILIALIALVLLPLVPIVRVMLPIDEPLVPLVVGLAACTLIGWSLGGRATLALVWCALAALTLAAPGRTLSAFEGMQRGWALVLAATFGLVCVFQPARPFLTRALSALGMTFGLGALAVAATPVTFARMRTSVESEYSRRTADALTKLATVTTRPEWKRFEEDWPSLAAAQRDTERRLDVLPRYSAVVFPSMLALESLAALALAWAIYHRVSRARIGAALAPLREFRFSDQLVWGVIVGTTILLLPSLAAGRTLGLNLLVFFGALYALRGLGVLTWMAPGRFVMIFIITAAFLALPFLSAFALGIGLVDTWLDWRSRARPTT